ncbi:VWA domain-containing protein [uncultured Polaribacter sp.]|uniref:VWA domain-containing protein n=1 Tax=uncultured Polaribacter sp. TaxID=174711 RepID=UPI00260211FF|nr:VWA domain-containing protein [uncultured Polaribacter sp.]
MSSILIIYLFAALLLSFAIGYFQYFYSVKNKTVVNYVLLVLRSLGFFMLFVLLINPKIKTTEIDNVKPVLSILIDNSKSIAYFKDTSSVNSFVNQLQNDNLLNDKFTIKTYYFDDDLSIRDSLNFLGNNTNISKAITQANSLYDNEIAPIVLLSDGNQTVGNDYSFTNSNQPIYPVVFGDTTVYTDLKINQINVNKYSYLNNKFPVEVLLNYEGNESVTSKFKIFNKSNNVVFSKQLRFSATENSKSLTANLTSLQEGVQYYRTSLQKVEGEKNIKNNVKNFSIEVIDEQTKILLLSSVLHPDIGAFKKAIESNKQRKVDVFLIDNFKKEINDYQLVILFEVNKKFKNIIDAVKSTKSNYLLVSGVNTDWNFINQNELGFRKNFINQTESYNADYNSAFQTYYQKDIGFSQFPPLQDQFGEIKILKEHQTLLNQNINGVSTQQPLLITSEENNQKTSVLFGQGIWKWRANSFLSTNSFQDFDSFIGNLIQYLSSNKKRNRLDVQAEKLFTANSNVVFNAFYTDKNYKFDNRASLEILITNIESKETFALPFSLDNNNYKTSIQNLPSGSYTYKVTVLGQNINRYGSFKITDFEIEAQFTRANAEKLQQLANKTKGKHYHKNEFENLKQELLGNSSYYTIQNVKLKEKNLIDWKWILFLIVALFSAEWFIRKYYGKI